jgi:hypothetical protein
VDSEIDLPRLFALNKYFREFPPVHILVAAFVGYKKPDDTVNSEEDMAHLIGAVPRGL